jgi:hypothetical protein
MLLDERDLPYIMIALPTLALFTTVGGGLLFESKAPPQAAGLESTTPIRKIDLQTRTFDDRFHPATQLPTTQIRVKTIAMRPETEPLLPQPEAEVPPKAGARTKPQLQTRPTNLCSKHGRRKVMIGRYKWRCKR